MDTLKEVFDGYPLIFMTALMLLGAALLKVVELVAAWSGITKNKADVRMTESDRLDRKHASWGEYNIAASDCRVTAAELYEVVTSGDIDLKRVNAIREKFCSQFVEVAIPRFINAVERQQ